jgi:multiple sugar transport system permease protein
MATRTSVVNSEETRGSTPKLHNSLLRRLWRARVSYAMLLVFFIPFIIFQVYQIARSAYLSLTDYSGSPNKPINYIGLENFKDLMSIQLVVLPRLTDTKTGEVMFQCGRSKVPASQLAATQAKGTSCVPAYANPRDYVSAGYTAWRPLYTSDSYQTMITATDTRFWTAVSNTVVYVSISVVIKLILGLLLALMLQRQTRSNMIMRAVFFLPSVTAGIAITVVWGWIFKGQSFGLANSMLMQLGISHTLIAFLADPNYMMPILLALSIWGGIGYTMILYLAGLQTISTEFYEAATVDGANTRDKFLHITLPLLRPTTVFLVITGIIGSFQVFDTAYILFNQTAQSVGGTLDAALTIVGYLYEKGFRLFQLGYASAIAWFLFIVIFILTLINLRVGRSNEAY